MKVRTLLFPVGLVGCVLSPIPDTRTPVDRAREFATRCNGFVDARSAEATVRDALDFVEPAYAHVATGNSSEQRLRGARLHLRPLPGTTSEWLERGLECHEVSVVLGKSAARVDDPFVLPNRWVDVDVDTEGDGFSALVRADTFDDAQRILARARRFAARAK